MRLHLVQQLATIEVCLLHGVLMVEAQLLKSADILDLPLPESHMNFG